MAEFTINDALDPQLAADAAREIFATRPDLHLYLASNPGLDADVLELLARSTDPTVTAILTARQLQPGQSLPASAMEAPAPLPSNAAGPEQRRDIYDAISPMADVEAVVTADSPEKALQYAVEAVDPTGTAKHAAYYAENPEHLLLDIADPTNWSNWRDKFRRRKDKPAPETGEA